MGMGIFGESPLRQAPLNAGGGGTEARDVAISLEVAVKDVRDRPG